jgi:hypothetical protein
MRLASPFRRRIRISIKAAVAMPTTLQLLRGRSGPCDPFGGVRCLEISKSVMAADFPRRLKMGGNP